MRSNWMLFVLVFSKVDKIERADLQRLLYALFPVPYAGRHSEYLETHESQY